MANRERRSDISTAERLLIRETAVMAHELTYQKLMEPKITSRLRARYDPEVVEVLDATEFKKLLTRPRAWVKRLLVALGRAYFVEIRRVRNKLELRGRQSDVQLAARMIPRTLLLARDYATAAYKGTDKLVPGSRKSWLNTFVTYEEASLLKVYENLAEQVGRDKLENLIGPLDLATAARTRAARQERRAVLARAS